jgi:hypothetical protein
MAQEQVLEHEVLARACPGQGGREQQPEQFEHASKIPDRRSREVLPSHNGTRFWADVIITALRDSAGQLIGFAKVTRDLTDRRKAEQERTARLAAERAAHRFERLQMATAALAAASRPETAAEELTDVAVRALGATVGVTGLSSADGSSLEIVAVRGSRPDVNPEPCAPVSPTDPLWISWQRREPLFVASGAHKETDKAERVGAYSFLHKPFDVGVLVQQVRAGLGLRPETSP